MQVTTTDGKQFTITGTPAELAAARALCTQLLPRSTGMVAGRMNRVEAANLRRLAATVAAPSAPVVASARRIELLAVATRDGLSHGKSWVCGARQVETGDAQPWMEGEMVCYVYAD